MPARQSPSMRSKATEQSVIEIAERWVVQRRMVRYYSWLSKLASSEANVFEGKVPRYIFSRARHSELVARLIELARVYRLSPDCCRLVVRIGSTMFDC